VRGRTLRCVRELHNGRRTGFWHTIATEPADAAEYVTGLPVKRVFAADVGLVSGIQRGLDCNLGGQVVAPGATATEAIAGENLDSRSQYNAARCLRRRRTQSFLNSTSERHRRVVRDGRLDRRVPAAHRFGNEKEGERFRRLCFHLMASERNKSLLRREDQASVCGSVNIRILSATAARRRLLRTPPFPQSKSVSEPFR